MDILRELFFGKILPYDQLHPTSKEYKEAVKESIRLEKQLFEELDEKRAMLFNKFTKVEIDVGTLGQLRDVDSHLFPKASGWGCS